jgi:hypothetical protein
MADIILTDVSYRTYGSRAEEINRLGEKGNVFRFQGSGRFRQFEVSISRRELLAEKPAPNDDWYRIYLKLDLPRRESSKQRTLLSIPMAQFYTTRPENEHLTDLDIELEGLDADLPAIYIVFRINKHVKDKDSPWQLLEFGDGIEYAVRKPVKELWDSSAATIYLEPVRDWITYQTKKPDNGVEKMFPYEVIDPAENIEYSFKHSLKPGDEDEVVLEHVSIPELDPNLFSAATARIYPSTTASNERYIFILFKGRENERVGYHEAGDKLLQQRIQMHGDRVDLDQHYYIGRKDPHQNHDFVLPVEGTPVMTRYRYPRPMARHEPSRKKTPNLEPATEPAPAATPLGRVGSILKFLKGEKS